MNADKRTTICGILAGVGGASAVGAHAGGLPQWFTVGCAMLAAGAIAALGYFTNKPDKLP